MVAGLTFSIWWGNIFTSQTKEKLFAKMCLMNFIIKCVHMNRKKKVKKFPDSEFGECVENHLKWWQIPHFPFSFSFYNLLFLSR